MKIPMIIIQILLMSFFFVLSLTSCKENYDNLTPKQLMEKANSLRQDPRTEKNDLIAFELIERAYQLDPNDEAIKKNYVHSLVDRAYLEEWHHPFEQSDEEWVKRMEVNIEKYVNKALSIDPKNGYAYSFIGRYYSTLKFFDKSITNYELAVKYWPERGSIWGNYAEALYLAERFNEAAPAYEKAFNLDNEKNDQFYFIYKFHYGISLAKSSKIKQAKKVLEDTFKDIEEFPSVKEEAKKTYRSANLVLSLIEESKTEKEAKEKMKNVSFTRP
jgi:tetratricopeptide (TPR) repeat protein